MGFDAGWIVVGIVLLVLFFAVSLIGTVVFKEEGWEGRYSLRHSIGNFALLFATIAVFSILVFLFGEVLNLSFILSAGLSAGTIAVILVIIIIIWWKRQK